MNGTVELSNNDKMSLSAEKIDENWKQYVGLLKKTGDRADQICAMIDALEERLIVCPASSKQEHHNAFPGGLVDHSLGVFTNAVKLTKVVTSEKVSSESLVIVCLLHDLGKVGDHEHDYYVRQTNKWRIDNLGEEYTVNKDLQYMTVPDRSLFLCQHFGVKLKREEFIAIKIHDGQFAPENAPYKFKEPVIADIVHMADYLAAKQEKERFKK